MTSSTVADPKLELIHHLHTIRDYAERMVINGEVLEPDEAAYQMACMRDYLTIGEEFGLTQKEMVVLVLVQDSPKERECGCHSCNARKET